MLRCYYKIGGQEIIDGVGYHTLVADESREDELIAEGWSRSAGIIERPAVVDEVLEALREQAKALGIKGYARMGEERLRDVLGLNDDDKGTDSEAGAE